MKRWRRSTTRYAVENSGVEAWLARIASAAAANPELAIEVARCQGLVKGYSDTHERGVRNFETVMAAVQKAGTALAPAFWAMAVGVPTLVVYARLRETAHEPLRDV